MASTTAKFQRLSAVSTSLRQPKIVTAGRLAALGNYSRPQINSYTDACEAPHAFWNNAITLNKDGTRTYSHPPEVHPASLTFSDVGSMYSMSNDDLVRYFQEGMGGRMPQLMVPNMPRGFLYRKQSHLIQNLIDKIRGHKSKGPLIRGVLGGKTGLILDGPTGSGKSALCCQAVHYARTREILTVYIPNAKDWTHGEWLWPSNLLPGFWDAPDATRQFLTHFARSHKNILEHKKLNVTPRDLPTDRNELPPTTWYGLCDWGVSGGAPANIDRQSVALKFLLDEIHAEQETPIVFVVDGMNLLAQQTHFRYPHPDFFKILTTLKTPTKTDIDLHVKEFPRIPSSRLTLMRGLNRIVLSSKPSEHLNKLFITASTRDYQLSRFEYDESEMYNIINAQSLEEYNKPFYAEKDTHFMPVKVEDFDEYEYRAFLRFLVNSAELAGLGWGPLWHFSSDFERKLYKIDFLSGRNPQRVISHYHQEILWRKEYQRLRQKQWIANKGKGQL